MTPQKKNRLKLTQQWTKKEPETTHDVVRTTPKRLKCTSQSLTGVYFSSLFFCFVCRLPYDRTCKVVYDRFFWLKSGRVQACARRGRGSKVREKRPKQAQNYFRHSLCASRDIFVN